MIQALERLGGIFPTQTVVVQGCGPVGLAATMLSRISGAKTLVVIGAPEHRLAMARRLGATATINLETGPQEAERVKQVYELTEGRGGDVVIEAAGARSAFGEGIKLTAKNGRYLIVGLWSGHGTVPVDPSYLNNRISRSLERPWPSHNITMKRSASPKDIIKSFQWLKPLPTVSLLRKARRRWKPSHGWRL